MITFEQLYKVNPLARCFYIEDVVLALTKPMLMPYLTDCDMLCIFHHDSKQRKDENLVMHYNMGSHKYGQCVADQLGQRADTDKMHRQYIFTTAGVGDATELHKLARCLSPKEFMTEQDVKSFPWNYKEQLPVPFPYNKVASRIPNPAIMAEVNYHLSKGNIQKIPPIYVNPVTGVVVGGVSVYMACQQRGFTPINIRQALRCNSSANPISGGLLD